MDNQNSQATPCVQDGRVLQHNPPEKRTNAPQQGASSLDHLLGERKQHFGGLPIKDRIHWYETAHRITSH
jgi:hypothetical protein